jgi:Spy/CpxP family protein refolding chaperone
MKRSHLSIAFYMLVVFVSGALVGALGHRLYTVRTVEADNIDRGRRSPSEFRQRYLTEMKTRLSLDDGQIAKLSSILDETRERFKAFNEKHRPEMSEIHETQVREIRAMLKPDQQNAYEEYRKERERKRQQHEKK